MSTIVENITKGEWFSCCTDNKPHFTFAKEGNVTICGFFQEQEISEDLSLEEMQANAQLIADSGTTANKCGKLPSELLAFKDYVHNRLDEMGIEKDPESKHKEHGCRIGGRLDIVSELLESNNELLEALKKIYLEKEVESFKSLKTLIDKYNV